jgi:hypothetical protein
MFADLTSALGSRRLNEILTSLSAARDRVLIYENGSGAPSPAALVPHVLAAVAYASGVAVPGEDLCCSSIDEADDFSGALEGEVAREGLLLLLACEDVAAGSRAYLANPGAAAVLRALLCRKEALILETEHFALVVRLLARVAGSHARSLLRSGCVRAAVEALQGAGQEVGSLDLLSSTVALIDTCAVVGADSRCDAAAFLDALTPLIVAQRKAYIFLAGPPALLRPPASSRLEVSVAPAILSGALAGVGVTTFVSRLSAIATGHWRQWDAFEADVDDRVPNNWAMEALSALADDGLLHLWAAALAAHATSVGRGPFIPAHPQSASTLLAFTLRKAATASLALAFARAVTVFRLSDRVTGTAHSASTGSLRIQGLVDETGIVDIATSLFDENDAGNLLSLLDALFEP